MKKETQKWQFYYYYQEGGKKHIANTKYCKAPERTKIYKQLLNSLDKGFIYVFGYQVIDSNKTILAMLRDRRWSTLYKGFTITQRNNGWYYASAYLYDTIYSTNLNDLKKQITKILK